MFDVKYLLYFILIHWIKSTPQINLYHTDEVTEIDHGLQHDCLHLATSVNNANSNRQLISYCMSESFAAFNVDNDDALSKFTFTDLSKQNITSEQLYIWSAPIDLIERYQLYLSQLSTLKKSYLATDVFYNCTLPRFGPMCQYEFVSYHQNYSSLLEIIYNYYHHYKYKPTNFTCYTQLQCDRGPSPACLDWSEICDGKVDCLDGEFDEEHCWQLDMNQCNENEYQCYNGQCIPKAFLRDDPHTPDCLDRSDEVLKHSAVNPNKCHMHEPSFGCEDVTCEYTPLTSSCVEQRKYLLMETVYSLKDSSVLDECWSAFKCILAVPDPKYPYYDEDIAETICLDTILNICPDILYVPNIPVLFGQIYTAYTKTDAMYLGEWARRSPYLCYNNSRYDDFVQQSTKISHNGSTCYRPKAVIGDRPLAFTWDDKYHNYLNRLFYSIKEVGRISNYSSSRCQRSNMYQCINSTECIPIYRIMDTFPDCPYTDDEDIFQQDYISDELEQVKENYYKCEEFDKYIHQSMLGDGKCDCGYIYYPICEDEDMNYLFSRRNISFQTICDGFIELSPMNLQQTNQTDETECEQWSCNNIYTRCDGLWNCLDGEDELGCDSVPLLNCSSNHHICVSPKTYKLTCLPIEEANDGKVDCLGGTDEPTLCRVKDSFVLRENFYCSNQSWQLCIQSSSLCNSRRDCEHSDDERFCEQNRTVAIDHSDCSFDHDLPAVSKTEKFLCNFMRTKSKQFVKYFTIDKWRKTLENATKPSTLNLSIMTMPSQYQPQCHRGLDLRVRFNYSTRITCLCPPSYYGNQCQYQNQRISLSLRFQSFSDSWQTSFAVVALLIDDSDERIIHSSEQLTYLSVRDCQTKFHMYLLYSNRSKNFTRNYFIHIDIFEKISLAYRGSLLFAINFPFLPVHRLGFIVNIPRIDDQTQSCSNKQCIHGKCIKYSNNQEIFCQCKEGWSGRYCNIQQNCICSSDSKCLNVSTANNRSICICPMTKFGSQCRLFNQICQTQCQNNGTCIPTDDYMVSDPQFVCLCAKGYSGDRCEIIDNKLNISFDIDFIFSRSIFIHFMEIIENQPPIRATTLRMFSSKDAIVIYWSRPFHLVFIEIPTKTYYLTVIQTMYNRSTTIIKTINPSDRCPHITELFNQSIVQLHLLRRIKYYHLPCQKQSLNLSCFYDDIHLCLCYSYNQKRLANCFNFNHHMKYDCFGRSECEHNGQCFQDSPDCPKRSMCVCRPCFYGRRCQFSTSGFGLSLDAILGYHILPNIHITHQSFIVKFSLTLTILFLLGGLIDGILSLLTFKNKILCGVGCGYYLLGSSITTLFTMVLFALKFIILLLAQMAIISNRSFLQVQCRSIDFLLRLGLYMGQWLNVCVAIERSVTIIQGASFSKKKSQQAAKRVIIGLLTIIIATSLHDPIYRRLIDEDNNDDNDGYEKRIWCTTNYSPSFQVYNTVLTTFHFFAPFIINLISAIILVAKKSRQQSNIRTKRPYKEILKENIREHKHLFTAPIVLVILAIPRLIISYTSKCMNSIDDSWLFLIGYFISFVPSMLTFIVFVLPSKFYTNEFHKTFAAYRNNIRRCFHWSS